MEKCPRYPGCSIPRCPLDVDAAERAWWPGEEICPFTIKKKSKSQRGIRTLALDGILKVIPKLNVRMLNRRNQKRWQELHQKVESEN